MSVPTWTVAGPIEMKVPNKVTRWVLRRRGNTVAWFAEQNLANRAAAALNTADEAEDRERSRLLGDS